MQLSQRPSTAVAIHESTEVKSLTVHACCWSTSSSCGSAILEQRVSGTTDSTRWTKSKACSFPLIYIPYIFMSVDTLSPLFLLQKSVTSRTCKLEKSARHPEPCRTAGNHCSDAQRTELKLKVDTVSIFFSRQRGNNSDAMVLKTMFIRRLWYRFTFCRSDCVFFSATLYDRRSYDKANIKQQIHVLGVPLITLAPSSHNH
jgi:hypothetical protein